MPIAAARHAELRRARRKPHGQTRQDQPRRADRGGARGRGARIEIVDCGLGLHWPAIDEDRYVPGVIDSLAVTSAA